MDSETITTEAPVNYQALYEQIRDEFEQFKLSSWKASHRYTRIKQAIAPVIELIYARLLDISTLEWIAALTILSIGLHYHLWLSER